jgi:hypothetical protein
MLQLTEARKKIIFKLLLILFYRFWVKNGKGFQVCVTTW